MRLHLGCGEDLRPGWVNVDARDDVGADVVGPAEDLAWVGDGEADEVMALDLLEHYPRARIPEVLAEWRRVLREGGELTLRVPNLEALARQIVNRVRVDLSIENIYGGHRFGPDGMLDAHHWGWTPRTLHADLGEAGFGVLANDGRANMTVRAVRPATGVASASPR